MHEQAQVKRVNEALIPVVNEKIRMVSTHLNRIDEIARDLDRGLLPPLEERSVANNIDRPKEPAHDHELRILHTSADRLVEQSSLLLDRMIRIYRDLIGEMP